MHKDHSIGPQAREKPVKPRKPHKNFPLYPHPTRRWAKKVRGKLRYFGPWDDPDAALKRWLEEKDDLLAGREPRRRSEGITVRELVNAFLTAKRRLADSREISPRTFADYHTACGRVVACLGRERVVADLIPEDFDGLRAKLAETRGPVALGNEIQRVKTLFKFAYESALINAPVRYGQSFTKPSKRLMRQARNERGARMFEAAQIRRLLDVSDRAMHAMILLGVNCGLGNHDVVLLPKSALDLRRRWLDFPRPKTQIGRRCPLWPETVAALKAWLKVRPRPKDDADDGLVFVTKYGARWARMQRRRPVEGDDAPAHAVTWIDAVGLQFGKLLKQTKLKRHGLGFYALRHTFETVAGGSIDQVAVDAIMGHAPRDSDMSAVYREKIADSRLEAVVEHVRQWLFPPKKPAKRTR